MLSECFAEVVKDSFSITKAAFELGEYGLPLSVVTGEFDASRSSFLGIWNTLALFLMDRCLRYKNTPSASKSEVMSTGRPYETNAAPADEVAFVGVAAVGFAVGFEVVGLIVGLAVGLQVKGVDGPA